MTAQQVEYLFLIWVFFGIITGVLFDQREMRKHVPYGRVPSGMPLRTVRTSFILVCLFVGFPMFIFFTLSNIRAFFWGDEKEVEPDGDG